MQIHQLRLLVPEAHEAWTDDDYAVRIVAGLARAAALELEVAGRSDLVLRAPTSRTGEVQEALVEALVLCLEWARRNEWSVSESFGLGLDWKAHGMPYMVLRATEGITSAHWSALNRNPTRAIESLNFALSYLLDYCRQRGWSLEEAASAAVNRGGHP